VGGYNGRGEYVLRIETWDDDAVTVVRPEDRLDILGYLELEDCLGRLLQHGRSRLVLDLEDASFISSSALGVISRFWADCTRAGGTLVIARPSREAVNYLRLGGVEEIVESFSSIEDAVVAASGGATNHDPPRGDPKKRQGDART
jgi:anti-anti-sigma factor